MSEDSGVGQPHGLVVVTAGQWAGWSTWKSDAFEERAGPFYERFDEDGAVCAFMAEQRHMNGGGFMHGGCLLTFADSALFTIARGALGDQMAVTLNLSGDFLDSAKVGERIESRGEVTRAGKSTIFVRGLITADNRPVLSFTGIIRKIGPSRLK